MKGNTKKFPFFLLFHSQDFKAAQIIFFTGEKTMIEVTKLNDVKILVNADLIEIVEETPDTVLTLTTGRKIIIKESRQEVKNLVKSYRKDIFAE